jgi:hypothetical protein
MEYGWVFISELDWGALNGIIVLGFGRDCMRKSGKSGQAGYTGNNQHQCSEYQYTQAA